MKKVFISGSMAIKKLDNLVLKSLDRIILNKLQVSVGDAGGVDKLVQEYFCAKKYFNVVVYTILDNPRNVSCDFFQIKKVDTGNLKGRIAQEKKDESMTKDSEYSFVIWDGKSKGSLNNILRALRADKKVKVFYEKEKRFFRNEELNIEYIQKIFYENNGLGLKELAAHSNLSLSCIKEIVKAYPQFKIISYYKGREQVKYSLELINVIAKEIKL
ncbi:hypothetical protein DSN97_04995 [Deferribacteraceae bacterium V6Fe1]|nr:hypothetical protein DSN97_04995 [Deferribacteraceae bacterium V6Fe1]